MIKNYADYIDYLEVHPEEFMQLFNTILINVTSFFRDQPAWDFLAERTIPEIIRGKKPADSIRVWSAGCSSGEEVFSIAMILAEALGDNAFHDRVKIYATDVDEEALNQARKACYTAKQLEPVPPVWRKKYFEQSGTKNIFRNDLRRAIIFGRHDLIDDAPISRLDLLICRNTIMYFNAEAQGRILARFHFALNNYGCLFLGRAEMLLTHSGLFSPVDLKHRIFSPVGQINLRYRKPTMAQAGPVLADNDIALQTRLREAAIDSITMAQLLVDSSHVLVFANDRARALFSLSLQDRGRPLRDLEISYRPLELRSLLDQCAIERRAITIENVQRNLPDNMTQHLEVKITPLMDAGSYIGASITFDDRTLYYKLQEDLQSQQHELETALEELQSSNEELETANEELQSSNEELETTNEELQSSNEELETMNEELQSTNAELQTLNDELQQRTDEVRQTNLFLQSILGSFRDGVVVLDSRMNIMAWNSRAEDLWGLRSDEVVGQAFFGLDIGLPVEKLKTFTRSCLACTEDNSQVTLDAITRRGKAIKCRVSCTPIIDSNKECHGAILVMEETIGK